MSQEKRVTRDNWKNPEYHVVAAIRKLRTDTNCPAGKSGPNHVMLRHVRLEQRFHLACAKIRETGNITLISWNMSDYHLSVTKRAVIGQFSGAYSSVLSA